jgi:hypothetical protein
MSFIETRTSDWEIASTVSVGGAAVFGTGVWAFQLKSNAVSVEANFVFQALGVGGGGWYGLTGVSSPSSDRFDPSAAYSPLPCTQAFSIEDLHEAAGIISSGGYGVGAKGGSFGLGAGAMAINAITPRGNLFTFITGGIGGSSVGASAFGGAGIWHCIGGKHYVEPVDWRPLLQAAKFAYKRYKAVQTAQAGAGA